MNHGRLGMPISGSLDDRLSLFITQSGFGQAQHFIVGPWNDPKTNVQTVPRIDDRDGKSQLTDLRLVELCADSFVHVIRNTMLRKPGDGLRPLKRRSLLV